MERYCKNCGAPLEKDSKFCTDCGCAVDGKNKSDMTFKAMLLILAGIIVIILLAGFFSDDIVEPEFEEYDFGYCSMLVPAGSAFEEYNRIGRGENLWAVGYENTLEDDNLYLVWISNYDDKGAGLYTFQENDADMEIYTDNSQYSYMIQRHVGDYYVQVTGFSDLDTLKEIAQSIEVKG